MFEIFYGILHEGQYCTFHSAWVFLRKFAQCVCKRRDQKIWPKKPNHKENHGESPIKFSILREWDTLIVVMIQLWTLSHIEIKPSHWFPFFPGKGTYSFPINKFSVKINFKRWAGVSLSANHLWDRVSFANWNHKIFLLPSSKILALWS